jgi:hypothetical protein
VKPATTLPWYRALFTGTTRGRRLWRRFAILLPVLTLPLGVRPFIESDPYRLAVTFGFVVILNAITVFLSAVVLGIVIERASRRLLRELPALVRTMEIRERQRGLDLLAQEVALRAQESLAGLDAHEAAFDHELRALREYIARTEVRAKVAERRLGQGADCLREAQGLVDALREVLDAARADGSPRGGRAGTRRGDDF